MNRRIFKQQFMLLLAFLFLFSSCKKKGEIFPSFEFSPYISAYTGGVISSNSTIRIEFTQEQNVADFGTAIDEKLFSFSPSVKGKCYWVNKSVIEFVPDSGALRPGTLYEATFYLSKVIPVRHDLKKFKFTFRVQERSFKINLNKFVVPEESPNTFSLGGSITFSELVPIEKVEKMFKGKLGKEKCQVIVQPSDDPYSYDFMIPNILKQAKEKKLKLEVNGSPAGIDKKVEKEVKIPAINDFSLYHYEAIHLPENGIRLIFTQPISSSQDLNGLISIDDFSNISCQRQDNEIVVFYEADNNADEVSVLINRELSDINGQSLKDDISVEIKLVPMSPQVKLLSEGVILPQSDNLLLPFQTVSLEAVNIEVIRIYESNVLMFLQQNTLSSNNELKRSGRLIYKKRLLLNPENPLQWENYSLNLKEIINQEPGAIYQIRFSFKHEDAAAPFYIGNDKSDVENNRGMISLLGGELSEEDESNWDYERFWGWYDLADDYEFDWENYSWQDSDNPYHPSYYMGTDKIVVTNVLASNIGVIVKSNSQKEHWIATTNIVDATPMSNVDLVLYNFQLQPIGRAKSDNNGFAVIKTNVNPFAIVASNGKSKSYLRLVDGEENSISRFDVDGVIPEKGLKGFIYGERGVWRPGDTLFLSFILEDESYKIPDNHPVSIELYNPKGQFAYKKISNKGIHGFYTFAVPTEPDAPTGIWNAYVKVGGATFHKTLRVETIKPNRLKITSNLDNLKLVEAKEKFPINIQSSWLTGAKANSLRVNVEVSYLKTTTKFKGYDKYVFDNPAITFNSKKSTAFDGKMNSEGVANFNLNTSLSKDVPGMLKAQFFCRVFENGGDVSIYNRTLLLSPFTRYVGINLLQGNSQKTLETDKDYQFEVVTLNAQGKPVAVNNLEYKIYKMDWSWWWENNYEDLSSYLHSPSIVPIKTGIVNTSKGKGYIKFKVDYPEWGRYLVYVKDKEGGHASGGVIYVDWPSWRGRSKKDDPSGLKMLTFTTNKEQYEKGETVIVTLPASGKGIALISLENGSSVLSRNWVELNKDGDTRYEFKVTEEMAPNVYIHVSLLQPHSQTVNDLPIRMYGVVPIFVVNKSTILHPEIIAPTVVRPESSFKIQVKEKNGNNMTYTLAIVDEGLLDITNFKTPNPWNAFYEREALCIKTWDLFDDVIGAFTGKYGSLFSIGGDEQLNLNKNRENRFNPVVKFLGPFTLKKGEIKTHSLRLPPYMGSVRVMVVAGQNGAYGNAQKSVAVRSPLITLSTLPRVVSVNETIELPVNVFAMENNIKDVSVTVSTTGKLAISGSKNKSTTFSSVGDKILYFTLKSSEKIGREKVTITTTANGKVSKEVINIEIRNPNPPVVKSQNIIVESGKSASIQLLPLGSGSNKTVSLEVSRIPSVDLNRRIEFLNNYEHNCSEQVVSKALPLLFISSFKQVSKQEQEEIKKSVNEAIQQLYGRQLANGGFVYWNNQRYPNDWVTSYVGMFLVLAKENGYEVNAGVIQRWISYQKRIAQNWRSPQSDQNESQLWQSDLKQAFRLYSLSLANSAELGAMNRLKEYKNCSVQTKWCLAASYAMNGKKKIANEIVNNLTKQIVPYSSGNSTFGSSLRDEAMILEALVLMDRQKEAFAHAKMLSTKLNREVQFTTQSTAFSLMAMSRLGDKMSGNMQFTWQYNNKSNEVNSAKSVFQQPLTYNANAKKVVLTNKGKGVLYANVMTRWCPLVDTIPASNQSIKIEVNYYDMNGKIIKVNELKKGEDIVAIVKVTNISPSLDFDNLALTHIIPSGWEIYNDRFVNDEDDELNSSPQYTYLDIRDDRILTYFSLDRNKSKEFRVRLQGSYAGNFILPAILCEDMYNSDVFARTKAERVVVK